MKRTTILLALGVAAAVATAAAQAQQPPSEAVVARSLAATCANCHGTNGQARGEMKPLAGMSAAKITATLADFRSGAMAGTIMPQIVKGYTDEQIRLIANHLAAQPAAK